MRYIAGRMNTVYDLKDEKIYNDVDDSVMRDYFNLFDIMSSEREKQIALELDMNENISITEDTDLHRFSDDGRSRHYKIEADNVTLKPMQTSDTDIYFVSNDRSNLCLDLKSHVTDITYVDFNNGTLLFPDDGGLNIDCLTCFAMGEHIEVEGSASLVNVFSFDILIDTYANIVEHINEVACIQQESTITIDNDRCSMYLGDRIKCLELIYVYVKCDTEVVIDLGYTDKSEGELEISSEDNKEYTVTVVFKNALGTYAVPRFSVSDPDHITLQFYMETDEGREKISVDAEVKDY